MRLTTGKQEELQQLLGEVTTINLMSLMGAYRAQQKQRQAERQQKREERKGQGLSEGEIAKLEAEEDLQADEATQKTASGNTLEDVEVYKILGLSSV